MQRNQFDVFSLFFLFVYSFVYLFVVVVVFQSSLFYCISRFCEIKFVRINVGNLHGFLGITHISDTIFTCYTEQLTYATYACSA